MNPYRIAFLVSGNGGSLKTVAQAIKHLGLPWQICLVLADRDCGALHFARQQHLPNRLVPYTRTEPEALRAALLDGQPDLIVTNIHKIIDPETLALFPNRFINLHYSLLPALKGYIGMETLVQARRLNVGIVGSTCHEVEEAVDSGRVLSQCGFAVDWRTERMEQVESLVFRAAGLALLDGLRQKAGERVSQSPTVVYQGKTLFCGPPLSFDPAVLDDAFWETVKNS